MIQFKMAAPIRSSDGMTDDEKIESKLHRIYHKCTRHGHCLVVDEGSSKNNSGYFRYLLIYPGYRGVNTTMHRAVYVLEKRRPDIIRNHSAGHVSHLCGTKSCVEISHLVLESSADNNRRITCHESRICSGGCSPPCIIH